MELTPDDVADILRALDGLPAGELRLETASFRLWLRRDGDGGWTQSLEVRDEPSMLGGYSLPAPREALESQPGTEAPEGDLQDISAPLLGTFYRAPRPGAAPFVEVGSVVEPDTVVCIIETMKLMNSVTAGVSGTVAAILVGNGQFAAQGAVLMRVRVP